MTTTFKKSDAGKPDPSLLPPRALLAVSRVLSKGAEKYGRDNWHKVDVRSRYVGALLRHVLAWMGGQDKDPDSGEPHLAHAACCVLFLLELEALGLGVDDRMKVEVYKPEAAPRFFQCPHQWRTKGQAAGMIRGCGPGTHEGGTRMAGHHRCMKTTAGCGGNHVCGCGAKP